MTANAGLSGAIVAPIGCRFRGARSAPGRACAPGATTAPAAVGPRRSSEISSPSWAATKAGTRIPSSTDSSPRPDSASNPNHGRPRPGAFNPCNNRPERRCAIRRQRRYPVPTRSRRTFFLSFFLYSGRRRGWPMPLRCTVFTVWARLSTGCYAEIRQESREHLLPSENRRPAPANQPRRAVPRARR
jgi:hypothetical protein